MKINFRNAELVCKQFDANCFLNCAMHVHLNQVGVLAVLEYVS